MVHHDACPICRSAKIILQFYCIDHFVSRESFPICKCAECGFSFTQDHPLESEAGRYYESDDYISHSDTSKGFSNKVYQIAREIMLHKKAVIVKKAAGMKKGSLLDIGCGTGHFARTMADAGWRVKGIEINEKARRYAIANFALDVTGPENISSLPADSYDCITLWHVLEHFHDPFLYLLEIRRLLKHEGICIIALPNNQSYDAEHYKNLWAAWDVPRHLWHFNPGTFTFFATRMGFLLKSIKILPLDVFYISTLSEKYKKSKIGFIKGLVKGLWFSVLTLFNRKKASSLIYIARK